MPHVCPLWKGNGASFCWLPFQLSLREKRDRMCDMFYIDSTLLRLSGGTEIQRGYLEPGTDFRWSGGCFVYCIWRLFGVTSRSELQHGLPSPGRWIRQWTVYNNTERGDISIEQYVVPLSHFPSWRWFMMGNRNQREGCQEGEGKRKLWKWK